MLEHLPTEGHLHELRYVSVIITELSGADIQLRQGKEPGNNTEASHYFRLRPLLGQLWKLTMKIAVWL